MNNTKKNGLNILNEWRLDYKGIDSNEEKIWSYAIKKIKHGRDFTKSERIIYSNEIFERLMLEGVADELVNLGIANGDVKNKIYQEVLYVYENFNKIFGFEIIKLNDN